MPKRHCATLKAIRAAEVIESNMPAIRSLRTRLGRVKKIARVIDREVGIQELEQLCLVDTPATRASAKMTKEIEKALAASYNAALFSGPTKRMKSRRLRNRWPTMGMSKCPMNKCPLEPKNAHKAKAEN